MPVAIDAGTLAIRSPVLLLTQLMAGMQWNRFGGQLAVCIVASQLRDYNHGHCLLGQTLTKLHGILDTIVDILYACGDETNRTRPI